METAGQAAVFATEMTNILPVSQIILTTTKNTIINCTFSNFAKLRKYHFYV
jgi:hypothetical protein